MSGYPKIGLAPCNEGYVKDDSSADLKQNPSKQKPRDQQAPDRSRNQADKEPVSQADGKDASRSDDSMDSGILSLGRKVVKAVEKATKQTMHELEEAGKILRQGITGQDEEIGKTKAEKDSEATQQYQAENPEPHQEAKQAKEARSSQNQSPEAGANLADPEQSSQQKSWREDINRSRGSGRDDSDRGRE